MRRKQLIKLLGLILLTVAVTLGILINQDDPPLVIVPSQYDAPLFVIAVNGKHGFIDPSGKIVIDPIYDKAYPFSDDLAAVNVKGIWGYIDLEGNMVIEPQYAMPGFFGEGLVAVQKTYFGPWGYIDKKGQIVIEPQFDAAHKFIAGFARVGFATTASKIKSKFADVGLTMNYKYIDRTGQYLDQPPPSHYAGFSKEELLLIKVDKLYGYCRADGRVVIEPQYRSALPFSDGLASIYVDGAWGYIDKSGMLVIEPQFKYAYSFAEGLAGVSFNEKNWGFINKSGDFVIEPKFGWIYNGFRHGLAKVLVDRKDGYINRKGDWVWEPSN